MQQLGWWATTAQGRRGGVAAQAGQWGHGGAGATRGDDDSTGEDGIASAGLQWGRARSTGRRARWTTGSTTVLRQLPPIAAKRHAGSNAALASI